MIEDAPIPNQKQKMQGTVPKEQFDQLALKYSELLKKSKMKSTEGSTENIEGLTKSLAALNEEAELAETVDVFKQKDMKKNLLNYGEKKSMAHTMPDYGLLENEILSLQKANTLLNKKNYDHALNILKELETSSHRQISVRAKFLIGELLFTQSEYDLALQVFSEIISRDAFSGVVLKTLGRMIVCADKLGQTTKKDKYYSILHDFFESA